MDGTLVNKFGCEDSLKLIRTLDFVLHVVYDLLKDALPLFQDIQAALQLGDGPEIPEDLVFGHSYE